MDTGRGLGAPCALWPFLLEVLRHNLEFGVRIGRCLGVPLHLMGFVSGGPGSQFGAQGVDREGSWSSLRLIGFVAGEPET